MSNEQSEEKRDYKSLTEVDNLRLDYYKKNPELIIESTEWTATGVCAICFGKIPLDNKCFKNILLQNIRKFYSLEREIPTCPHCRYSNKTFIFFKENQCKRIYLGIPYLIVRYRYHILGKIHQKSLLGRIIKTKIDKIQEMEVVRISEDIDKYIERLLKENPDYARGH